MLIDVRAAWELIGVVPAENCITTLDVIASSNRCAPDRKTGSGSITVRMRPDGQKATE